MKSLSGKFFTGLVAAFGAATIAKADVQFDTSSVAEEVNLTRPTREQVRLAKDLPQTLVIRVNDMTGEFEVLNSRARLDRSAQSKVVKAKFKKATSKSKIRGRVKGGQHLAYSPLSWLLGFSFGGYSRPYYSYGNYNYPYSHYDSWSYGDGYTYNYYGNPFWGSYGW